MELFFERSPLILAAASQLIILLLAIALTISRPTLLPELAPVDPASLLTQLWQVHTGFVAIAFAGLALLFQLAAEPVVTSRSLRSDLFRHTFFTTILLFALAGAIQLGIVAIWFPSSGALVVEFFFVGTTTIVLVALAYLRAAKVFVGPSAALELGKRALIDQALDSLYHNWVKAEANRRLEALVPRDWTLTPDTSKRHLVVATRPGRIEDVRISPINDVVAELEAVTLALPESTGADLEASEAPTKDSFRLNVMFWIGAHVEAGDPLFALDQALAASGVLDRIEGRLHAAIQWEGKNE